MAHEPLACPRCRGFLCYEPARARCVNCGGELPRGGPRWRHRLQLLIDFALRPASLGSTDAHTPEEYAEIVGAAEVGIYV